MCIIKENTISKVVNLLIFFILEIACEEIRERLKPYQMENPKGKWEDWVSSAYFDRVNLSSNGFYK